ncbi:unnamed protein product [Paramecium octaurelia]|uniref:Uncharacterized protein n=1 Tax=Paramecium octaurelia TaxID=43137 RepID=A0A8S1VV86_PAROT|nr:unnamed protein product [Paramecium octaurelia]
MIMPSNHKLKNKYQEAFEDLENPICSIKNILEVKEKFSDGVGDGWRDGIIERANQLKPRLFILYQPLKIRNNIGSDKFILLHLIVRVCLDSTICQVYSLLYRKSFTMGWVFKKNAEESGRAHSRKSCNKKTKYQR